MSTRIPAGNIWITDSGQGGTMVKFNPKDQNFTPYPSPQGADKPSIEVTDDGAILYGDRGVDRTTVTHPGLGVLYPDMDNIRTLAVYPGTLGRLTFSDGRGWRSFGPGNETDARAIAGLKGRECSRSVSSRAVPRPASARR